MRVLVTETTWTSMAAAKDLADAGMLVTRAGDGEEALDFAAVADHNVILIDHDLPDRDAADLIRTLRRRNPTTGLVLIAPPRDMERKLKAFAAGADDVVSSDAETAEILARVGAVGRRRAGRADPVIRIADLAIDTARHRASVGAAALPLTRIEYELLELLALRQGQVVSKDAIMTHLYSVEDAPDPRIIAAYVCHIRTKITAAGGDAGVVENVWGRGYALVDTRPLKVAA